MHKNLDSCQDACASNASTWAHERRRHVAFAFSMLLVFLPAILFAQSAGRLRPAGLQGKKVTALGFYNSVYAGTENEGVFRFHPFSSDSVWTPMGLEGKKILTVYPHKFGPIGFAVSVGVQPDRSQGDSALVYCSIFDQTEWTVTDSGLDRRAVPWIKSLDGFPDPTICGETFAAGPGTIFRRYFLSPQWEEVFDVGLGLTNVIRADEFSAHVWAGGGTAIRMPWLARSRDKGATWELSFPFFNFLTTCRSIAIQPGNSDQVYAGLEEAVIRSRDGGTNWELTGLRVPSAVFEALAIDPLVPNHILAGGSEANLAWELWESSDGGAHWAEISPPIFAPPRPMPAISSIIAAPDTVGAFFIGTLGEGVWRYQGATTEVEEENRNLPAIFALEQNYPNPFNPATEIRYRLASTQRVRLEVFDVAGHLMVTLLEGMHPPGDYQMRWDGKNANGEALPSGVYFLHLRAGASGAVARKMMLLR